MRRRRRPRRAVSLGRIAAPTPVPAVKRGMKAHPVFATVISFISGVAIAALVGGLMLLRHFAARDLGD